MLNARCGPRKDTACFIGPVVRSELQLGSSPVSPSSVVPDCVVRPVPDPVGQRAVLLDFLATTNLLAEGLYRTHFPMVTLLLIINQHDLF